MTSWWIRCGVSDKGVRDFQVVFFFFSWATGRLESALIDMGEPQFCFRLSICFHLGKFRFHTETEWNWDLFSTSKLGKTFKTMNFISQKAQGIVASIGKDAESPGPSHITGVSVKWCKRVSGSSGVKHPVTTWSSNSTHISLVCSPGKWKHTSTQKLTHACSQRHYL